MEMEVSQNEGYLFGGPHNKDHSIFGSILGPPILGNYQMETLNAEPKPLNAKPKQL